MDRRLRDRLPALTWNPLRDEAAAFQLVFVTIGVGGLIALGSWISTWAGIGVVIALVIVAGALVWRRQRVSDPEPARRLLFVGQPDAELIAALRSRAEVRVADPRTDVAAAVENALQAFAADEIIVPDPATADTLRARFVVPVRVLSAEDYLPETASK